MKRIIAIIRPFKLTEVRAALGNRVEEITVEEVRGFGRQYGHSEIYRGTEYKVEFVPKVRLEILCEDREAPFIIDIIADAARTGKIGDGKIFLFGIGEIISLDAEKGRESGVWGAPPVLKAVS